MKRMVQTSSGWVELKVDRQNDGKLMGLLGIRGGLGVVVTRFGPDGWSIPYASGRHDKGELFNAPTDGEALAAFLAEIVNIPADEAERIASETVDGSEQRLAPGPLDREALTALAATAGLIAVGAAALIVTPINLLRRLRRRRATRDDSSPSAV